MLCLDERRFVAQCSTYTVTQIILASRNRGKL